MASGQSTTSNNLKIIDLRVLTGSLASPNQYFLGLAFSWMIYCKLCVFHISGLPKCETTYSSKTLSTARCVMLLHFWTPIRYPALL